MIVNIRGTHGSGKSTLVREVMKRFDTAARERLGDSPAISTLVLSKEGRKRPIGYKVANPFGAVIHVVGHYETACGGCDSISVVDEAYEEVLKAHKKGCHVLFEGILAQHSTPNLLKLHKALFSDAEEFIDANEMPHFDVPLRVIVLDVDPQTCVASVQARRDAKGDTRPLKPDNILKEHKSTLNAMRRLREHQIPVLHLDRDKALIQTLSYFGMAATV